MWEDPIVAEVRKVRSAHAAKFKNDLQAIFRDLKAQEKQNQVRIVSFPARRVERAKRTQTVMTNELVLAST